MVGQEHVVRTLSNAVERGKVHHAYLFVGSRGTGKTSMAKILAACLNCEAGPTIEPCGECESCVSIASATSLDVIEMDAASNNSVDDIRDLREKVGYAPVAGRYKVYILDEAHMLSSQAWNAFLKTLEEPPPHTIFVLATTEAQKVLPTVVDRCHRFDFGRPSVEQIGRVLRRVAEEEAIDVPDAALALLARAATGSFRDALGTLEQLVTYSGADAGGGAPRIALDDVLAVLGIASADLLFETVDAVATHDARAALLAGARLVESGRDPGQFLRDLESHARELLVVQTLGEVPSELRLTAERDERLAEQARRLASSDVVRLLDLISAGLGSIREGAEGRIQLELALVKAAAPAVDPSSRALLARIDRLEARLAGASAPRASVSPAPAPAAVPARVIEPSPSPSPAPAPARTAGVAVAALAAEPEPAPEADLAPDPLPELDLDAIVALWPAAVESLAAQSHMLAALFADARPVRLAGEEVTVAFPTGAAFLKRQAETEAHRAAAAEALRAVAGRSLRLCFELRDPEPGTSAPALPESVRLSEDEWIARFVSEFDAEEILDADATQEGS